MLEALGGSLLLFFLFGGIPCSFVVVMLAMGVSKKNICLILGVPAAALAVWALILWIRWDGIPGEVPPGWLFASGLLVLCFGPPFALLGLSVLYRRFRPRPKRRMTTDEPRARR